MISNVWISFYKIKKATSFNWCEVERALLFKKETTYIFANKTIKLPKVATNP